MTSHSNNQEFNDQRLNDQPMRTLGQAEEFEIAETSSLASDVQLPNITTTTANANASNATSGNPNPLENVRFIISTLQTELIDLTAADVRNVAHQRLRTVTSLLKSYKEAEELLSNPSNLSSPVSSNKTTLEPTTMSSASFNLRIPVGLPEFRTKANNSLTDPHEFLSRCIRVFEAAETPQSRWMKIIATKMPHMEAEWLQHHLISSNINWEEQKKKFLEHFCSPMERRLKLKELHSIKSNAKESVQAFTDRFENLRRYCGIAADADFILELYKSALPKPLEMQVQMMEAAAIRSDPNYRMTIQELATHAISFEAILGVSVTSNGPNNNNHSGQKVICHYCKMAGHKENECRGKQHDLKHRVSDNKDKGLKPPQGAQRPSHRLNASNISPKAAATPPPDYVCRRCNKPGHFISRCMALRPIELNHANTNTNSITVSPPDAASATNPSTTPPASSQSNESSIYELQLNHASTTGEKSNLIVVDVELNGKSSKAMIDSGATTSFIPQELVKGLNITVTPASSGSIETAFSAVSQPRIGTVDLRLKFGSRLVQITSEVIRSPAKYFIIGLDLFKTLGLYIGNLPGLTSEGQRDWLHLPDEKSLVFNPQSFDPLSIPQWKMHLLRNIAIPKHAVTTLPDAQITIDTADAPPVYIAQYTIPHAHRAALDKYLEDRLEHGVFVLAPAHNQWNFSLISVPKKTTAAPVWLSSAEVPQETSTKRWCMDLRALNAITADNKTPLPLITDIFDSLAGSQFFTTLDMENFFHAFPVRESDQIKYGFTINGIKYMATRGQFGDKRLPGHVTAVLARVLGHLSFVRFFIDDIVIFSQTREEHLHHVAVVLETLTKYRLKLGLAKCQFFQRAIRLLGHVVDSNGIRPDPEKLSAMINLEKPKTPQAIQRFMGLVNYYARHFPNLSVLAAPLHAERAKSSFEWTAVHEKAFQDIVNLLLRKPITLAFPDPAKDLILYTDASKHGFGCVLGQRSTSEDLFSIIACFSRTTSSTEKNYSPTMLELAALVWALLKTETYVLGRRVQVFSDHKALSYLHTQKSLNSTLERWFHILLRFDFTISYMPGKSNVIADLLSRPVALNASNVQTGPTQIHFDILRDKTIPRDAEISTHLEEAHAFGHFGERAMFDYLWRKNLWWPSIRRDIKDLLATCNACQRYSYGKHGYHPLRSISSLLPMDHLAMDCMSMPKSSRGYKVILTVRCLFTHFMFLIPLKQQTAVAMARSIWSTIFLLFGFPSVVQSDNGKEFVNHIMLALVKLYGIDHRTVSAYHPRANGAAERPNLTIRQSLLKLCQGNLGDWDIWIPFVQFSINSKVSALTGSTPFSLMFGRNSTPLQSHVLPLDDSNALDNWKQHHATLFDLVYPSVSDRVSVHRKKAIADFKESKRILSHPYPLGSLVMVYNSDRHSKTDPLYIGPCTVIHVNRNQSYSLRSNANHVYHKVPISHLKLLSRVPISNPRIPNSFSQSSAASYAVRSILSHNQVGDSIDYLVQWVDRTLPSSWVSAQDFDDPKLISRYWKSLKQSPPQPKIMLKFRNPLIPPSPSA